MQLRKYATEDFVIFPLITYGDTDFIGADPTLVAGDCKISKDGVAYVNTTNLPVWIGEGLFKLILTAAEYTGKKMLITIKDQDGPAWEDQAIYIETYGNANAQHPTMVFRDYTSVVIPYAPTAETACRVYEYVFMPDGITPVDAINAIAKIVSLPEDINSVLHTGQELEATYQSADGLIYWDIVQGAIVEFTIPNFGYRSIKTIPSTSTARLYDIT